MTDQYRISKHAVSAEVSLVGQPAAPLRLFLSAQARTHDGSERIIDLLNGGTEAFFPAIDERGALHILRRDAVLVVTVPARDADAGAAGLDAPAVSGSLTRAEASVVLDDGTVLSGVIEYVMPESQRRLQDYLNFGEEFLTLRRDGVVHFVNKRHITRVDAVGGGA